MAAKVYERISRRALCSLGMVALKEIDGSADEGVAILAGDGAPASATYGDQTLATGQNAIALRANATSTADLLNMTIDGGTNWDKVISADALLTPVTGPNLIGVSTGNIIVGVADVGAELDVGGTAQGIAFGDGAGVVDVGTIQTATTGVTAAGANTGTGTASITVSTLETREILPVLGPWAVDGDGAATNGGGLVGAVPSALVSEADTFALVWDEGTGAFALLSASSSMGGGGVYTADFQLFPDADAIDDAVYFGATLAFCEVAFTLTGGQTYANDSLVWEYWDGAAWTAIPTLYDNTDTTAQDGLQAFQQSGALTFDPPADWTATTLNGQLGFWIRSRVTAANITLLAIASDEHAIVTSETPWVPQRDCTLQAVTINDNATTLHTTADVIFVIIDRFTGESRTFTFAQDRRRQRFSLATPWDLTTSSRLQVHVVQEDGAAEPTGVLLELELDVTLTATDAGHDHTAGAITVTDAGHGHTIS